MLCFKDFTFLASVYLWWVWIFDNWLSRCFILFILLFLVWVNVIYLYVCIHVYEMYTYAYKCAYTYKYEYTYVHMHIHILRVSMSYLMSKIPFKKYVFNRFHCRMQLSYQRVCCVASWYSLMGLLLFRKHHLLCHMPDYTDMWIKL